MLLAVLFQTALIVSVIVYGAIGLSVASGPALTAAAVSGPTLPGPKTIGMRLLRASSIYGLANLGIRALNFLLLPIYTRYLGPADYGIISLAETLAAFFASIVSMGFDASIQRLYFRHIDDPESLTSYVGTALKFALVAQGMFIVLVLTVGPRLQAALAPSSSIPYRYFGMSMITAMAVQFFNYRLVLYQAEQRPWAYATLALLSFIATASLCVGLVVFAHYGVLGMLGGKLIAASISLVVALVLVAPTFRRKFEWKFVRETVSLGVPLVPHLLMALGLVTADRFILAHYRDLREVGLYTVAYTLGMVMSLITMSLTQAWAPVYYDVANKGEASRPVLARMCSGLVIVLTVIACFGVLIAQPFVSVFLDHRYSIAGQVAPWIIAAYLAHSLFSMLSLACMQARRSKLIMISSFVGLSINTILNFALIPHWGMYGAAYATLVGYALEAAVMYWCAQRSFRLDYDLRRTFTSLAAFAVVLAVTQMRWSPGQRPLMVALAALLSFGTLAALGRVIPLLRSSQPPMS